MALAMKDLPSNIQSGNVYARPEHHCSDKDLLVARWLVQIAIDDESVLQTLSSEDKEFLSVLSPSLTPAQRTAISKIQQADGKVTINATEKDLDLVNNAVALAKRWFRRYSIFGWTPEQLPFLEDITYNILSTQKERRVFNLHYVRGLEIAEVAKRVGMRIDHLEIFLEQMVKEIECFYLISDDWTFAKKPEELIEGKILFGIVFYQLSDLGEFKRNFDAFIEEASKWIEGRELPIQAWFFAFIHGEGCNCTELATQMGKLGRSCDVNYAINVSKQITAIWSKGRWKIEQCEVVRVLDIHCNRIGLRQAAIEKGYVRHTLESYGNEGLLGKIIPNISGADSILRSVYDQLDELVLKIAQKKARAKSSWGKKKLKKGELSPGSIYRKYKKLGLELGIIKHWLKKEMLLSTTRGKFRFILADDFRAFAIKTAHGENATRLKYQQIFQEICKKEGWI